MIRSPRTFVAAAAVVSAVAVLVIPPPRSRHDTERGARTRTLSRTDKPQEAAHFYAKKRAPVGQSAIPVERYLAARQRMRAMPRHVAASAELFASEHDSRSNAELGLSAVLATWTPLGPGNVGGRTRALVIDPGTPDTMYAAGVAGGVWKTTNAGTSWTPLDDMMANLAVSTLAMDPNLSTTLYAGTGEGFFNGDAVRGSGIFKTTNGGTTWTHLSATNNASFHYVNKVVVSKNSGQRVYAATRTGVWRSLDAGTTFTRVLDPGLQAGCTDLAIRTDLANDTVFAACGSFEPARVYRNTDAGGSGAWESVFAEPDMGRTSLALAPSDQNVIYAVAASTDIFTPYNDGLHAVFRSTTGGGNGSWTARVRNTNATKLNTVLLSNPIFAFLTDCGLATFDFFINQGWYDNAVAVDPVDSNRLWVGGVDLFRSDDGGANWGLASYWPADPTHPHYAHADQHAIVFHPGYDGVTNKTLYAAGDGGIFRTTDARAATATGAFAPCDEGNSAINWTELNNNYGVTQFYHGTVYPDGASYFGGTQDNGTVRGTDAGGADTWTTLLGGDGGAVAVDPNNTNILYAENTDISIKKSIDGGATFVDATNGIFDFGLFITPFIMDPSNSLRLWIGGSVLWRTADGAANWVEASTALTGTPGEGVSAIAAAPSDGNVVLAGLSTGAIHRNTAALSATFETVWPAVVPRAGYVSSLAFDPGNANVAYATYSTFGGGAHVWKSVNGGQTWAGIDGSGATGIPDIPVHSIVVDPGATQRLFVGTDLGVFASEDGGATWAVENTGFANTVVEQLVVRGSNLFAFTHGRGVFKTALSTTGPALSVNPTSLAFPTTTLGQHSDLPLTVTNSGTGTLSGSGAFNGAHAADFSFVGASSYALGPSQSTVLTIRFAPGAVGARNASLTLTGGGGAVVALSGTGNTAGPALSVNTTSLNAGGSVQVTVSGGPGNTTDWVGLYAAGATHQQILDWKYLNGSRTAPTTGLTTAVLSFTLQNAGPHELRFFSNNGYTLLATSATVTVTAGSASASAAPASVAGGGTVTVTVSGGPANTTDWVGLYAASASDLQVLDWRYLNGAQSPPQTGLASASLTFTMPLSAGAYEFRFFANNAYQRLANSGTVTVQPSSTTVTSNLTSVAGGGTVLVTIANGPGNARDWVGLFAAGASDLQITSWKYLNGSTTPPGAGTTNATVAFTMPLAGGSYEFRLFRNDSYQRLAVSPSVTVLASTATLTPNATTVAPGGLVQVVVAGGPANANDWVGLFATAATDFQILDWRYLNGTRTPPATGVTGATLTFQMPQTPGTYNFRFFRNDSYERLVTSVTVTVQ